MPYAHCSQREAQLATVRVLDKDGELVGDVPDDLGDSELRSMVRLMMLGRRTDQAAIALTKRGKLSTYPPLSGQEAATVGSVFALDRERDWVVPQYREQLALFHMGLPLSTYLLRWMRHHVGAEIPPSVNVFPQQVALAAHLPHAVGLAWGMRLRKVPSVVIAYFGDGASSEGDFHESCNLAGVQRAPVILFCQNNGWAISTPWERQSASPTIASRGPGYGVPGVLVDGNDLLAVYKVTREARLRALAGLGPTLIEAVTTRLGPHTTSDDPSRYISAEHLQAAWALDPLVRVKRWLSRCGRWVEEDEILAAKWCDEEVRRAVEEFEGTPVPGAPTMFDNVFADEPARLRGQRASLSHGEVVR